MQRIPEPELMLDDTQAEAYARADFESAHASFVEQLTQRLPSLPERAHVLDVGCGACDVTRRLAQRFPEWRIDAIDGSAAMLKQARECLKLHGLSERISLHQRVLPRQTPPRSDYDVIVSNSLLHHLERPSTLWRDLRAWGKRPSRQRSAPAAPEPEARTAVFVMDLTRPASPEAARRLVELHAGREPEILRKDFEHSLFAAYTLEEVRAQLQAHALDHFGVQTISDRHWIAWGTLD